VGRCSLLGQNRMACPACLRGGRHPHDRQMVASRLDPTNGTLPTKGSEW
jgi:hypothetical protein